MADAGSHQWPKLRGATCYLDVPQSSAIAYAECIPVSGWLHAPDREAARSRIRGWINGSAVGETNLLFVRPDVCSAMNLPPATATGFRFLAHARFENDTRDTTELTVTASWSGEDADYEIARTTLRLLSARLTERPYGEVVHPAQETVLHRANIYGSGPPVEEPGAETLQLIEQYLGANTSVVDVGCGAGAYGHALIAAGHDWLGLEVNPNCWERLAARALPFRKVDKQSGKLPSHDGEFDDAVCIEVLEHIEDVHTFLGEMARVLRRRALFSVPNMEVLPYFSAWQVVPWHLLEADHKNFFTRTSLRDLLRKYFARVEVFSYAEHPLRTPEGVPLHVHLFAIAEK